jgi:hypothetical protein
MAVLSSPQPLGQLISTIREVISRPSNLFGEVNEGLKMFFEKFTPFFASFEKMLTGLEEEGLSRDFWLLSTYLHVTKIASRQVTANYSGKFMPVIALQSIKVSTILPANMITKVLFSLKKQPKIRKIIEKFITQKGLEFKKSLDIELGKIPESTPAQIIQEYKNYFTNTRGSFEDYTTFRAKKQLEEEQQRKLDLQTAKIKEEKIKAQIKHEEEEFQERGGYDSVQIDQIQSARKKALTPKKKTKKTPLPHGIEEKMEQKKLQEELKSKSEDRAQKFFQEKQKRQQDYIDKLKKFQQKGKD